MAQGKWRTLTGTPIPDLAAFLKEETRGGQVVHIGTDSLQTNGWTQFCTVVAILTPGKGGRVAYRREAQKRINSLRERLLKEVWLSVELGMEMAKVVPGELTIHVDANSSQKYKSSKWVEELAGLVVSQGFNVRIKPDAWAASCAADHIVRTKGRLPREVVQKSA